MIAPSVQRWFSFFFFIVLFLLSGIEMVPAFWLRNQDNRTVVGFGVGAGKCHKVMRGKNLFLLIFFWMGNKPVNGICQLKMKQE